MYYQFLNVQFLLYIVLFQQFDLCATSGIGINQWALFMKQIAHSPCALTLWLAKMREHRAVLYMDNGCMTQTRLCVCLVHNSMVFANQQGLYACVNVIRIFYEKGSFQYQYSRIRTWYNHRAKTANKDKHIITLTL